MNKILILGLITASLFLGLFGSNNIHAVKCEDIKHEGKDAMKWSDSPDEHHNPSKSKFNNMVWGKATACEVSKCYDWNICDGTIKESKYDAFRQTFTYMGTTEDVQKCFEKRMDLGDSLAAYEIHHCQVGSY